MLSTRTYDEFMMQTEALCGTTFTATERNRVMSLGNLAAKRAYKESEWWERWLVASEPRTASRGRVDASEDSYYVFGAGTAAVNGLYVRNSNSVDGNAMYSLYDTDGTTILYYLRSESNTTWYISSDAEDQDIQIKPYSNTSSSATPPASSWQTLAPVGVDPAPLVTALADIDTYMSISGTDTIRDSSSRPISFYVDSSGANLRSNSETDVVWVTYKKANTAIYGDGNGNTTETIPAEFFNYMSLYAAYMYQSSQRQNNPNAAYGMALREVDAALEDELIRLEDQHITINLAQNISTGFTTSNTLI